MTETIEKRPLPDPTMTSLAAEWILLWGPCDQLMSFEEYGERRQAVYDIAVRWTEAERTEFWFTLDRLCAEANPAVRATPGLVMSPENPAYEDSRIRRVAYALGDGEEPEGFQTWGLYLYTDPVSWSFNLEETIRYATTKTTRAFPSGLTLD